MTEEQKKEADSLYWWHRISLSPDYTTKGECPHGNELDFDSRFGLPDWLQNQRVLDIGGYDGLFSFECEKRGAKRVLMLDIYQNSKNKENPNRPFQLAKEVLKSQVEYQNDSLESFTPSPYYFPDLILFFGVLYHLENPLGAIKKLMKLASSGTVILVETTISNSELYNNSTPVLEYKPRFDNDPTNQFYPNKAWIKKAFKEYGAQEVQVIYKDDNRATFRIIC